MSAVQLNRCAPPQRHRAQRREHGFSLLEVLIALLVLSVGLLGLAGMQAHAVSFNHSAYMRSQATNLAYDLGDRMRANRQAALAGEYTSAFPNPVPACAAAALNGSIANQDLVAWRRAVACALPGGSGQVQRAGNQLTITLVWNEGRNLDSTTTEQFAMVIGL